MQTQPTLYLYHRLSCDSLQWKPVAQALWSTRGRQLEEAGGALYGIWRSQIGRPRDELTVITSWSSAAGADGGIANVFRDLPGLREHTTRHMVPTLRPTSPERPTRQGNYAFRSFETKAEHWDEFLALSKQYWPDFEASFDSQVVGLWRFVDGVQAPANEGVPSGSVVKSLLLTRRPDLAMWERSKIPRTEKEAKAREAMIRRYDICEATEVCTTTLLSADDREDTVRWT